MNASSLPDDLRVFARDWLSSNNLLCLGGEPALIDTGHVKHAAETVRLVEQALGLSVALSTIAHTHLHSDHCGGTAALQAAYPSALTWVPKATLPHVQAWDEDALTFGDTAQRCARFTAQRALTPGQTVRLGQRDWQIHAAPGHDRLAVLLFEPLSGVLLAGDAMWEHGVGIIFEHIEGGNGFTAFIDTLALIERLEPAVVIPGHGVPFARADGAIDAALTRARQRVAYFADHPAQHALYAAKVLLKYQFLDAERMTRPALRAWIDNAPILRRLHRQHRPDLLWDIWLSQVLASLSDKGALQQTDIEVINGL
ncbi:MAG: MBL fold metallo-hydrolase [Burkholderiaceae bacterium]|jgi:glyoxylase-like metal-dependent hydrolase (beta-lactamase superfamily II)|nr:MBL fold metallo-hydrolase [Burkholderiaceae bacterium]